MLDFIFAAADAKIAAQTALQAIFSDYSISNGEIYLREDQTNSATLLVSLSRNPGQAVTVNITAENNYVIFDQTTLNFNETNWGTSQQITITAVSAPVNGVKYENVNFTVQGVVSTFEVRTVDNTINSQIYNTEPLSQKNSTSDADLITMRNSTIDWIWGTGYGNGDGALPTDKPGNLGTHINDSFVDGSAISNLQDIIKSDYTFGSTTWKVFFYHFRPATGAKNEAFVFPSGHGDNWVSVGTDNGYNLAIDNLVSNGYDVIYCYMIGRGPNTTDNGVTQGTGGNGGTHDQMASLESTSPYFNPFNYFISPYIIALNYLADPALSGKTFTKYYYGGLSGGGWASCWVPSLDTRYSMSFDMAGSYPNFIRDVFDRTNDYEQGWNDAEDPQADRTTPFIVDQYNRVRYLDLYCMAMEGGRLRRQYNNVNDSVISFSGHYNTVYKEELKKLGYPFDGVIYDAPGQHIITQEVMDDILSYL